MTRFLLVCAGGAIGSGARYLAILFAARFLGGAFPFGTLLVNVVGSFLLGLLMTLAGRSSAIDANLRLFVGTGVLGGFTTYSTFNHETTSLLRDGAWTLAAANVAGTLLGCLAAGALGVACARLFLTD